MGGGHLTGRGGFGIIWPLFGDWTHASSWGGGAFRFEHWAGVLVMGRRLIKTPRIHTEGHNASSTPFLRSMGPFVKYAKINLLLILLIPTRVVRLGHFPIETIYKILNPG